MAFPERFSNLPEYAFPRLRALLNDVPAGGDPIAMSLGEPQHPIASWIPEVIAEATLEFGSYPINSGTPELRAAISDWIKRRYAVAQPADQIMVLNGSREGLFAASMALSPEMKSGKAAKVLMPNPFYQVYAVGAVAAGATPVYLPATADTGFLPDFQAVSPDVLDQTTLAFICSPANPQGAVASMDYYKDLLALAEKHDFKIVSDECYSEIYTGNPPPSALQAAAAIGADTERVVVINSLSKRSSVPGLRSGFVASGLANIAEFNKLRAYSGAPVPGPLQRVAERLWADEDHVVQNRALYAEKFSAAHQIFADVPQVTIPEGGFFLWMDAGDGEAACRKLWRETGVRVLPGAYLARDVDGQNPARNFIRVALVAPKEETQRGLTMIRDCLFN